MPTLIPFEDPTEVANALSFRLAIQLSFENFIQLGLKSKPEHFNLTVEPNKEFSGDKAGRSLERTFWYDEPSRIFFENVFTKLKYWTPMAFRIVEKFSKQKNESETELKQIAESVAMVAENLFSFLCIPNQLQNVKEFDDFKRILKDVIWGILCV